MAFNIKLPDEYKEKVTNIKTFIERRNKLSEEHSSVCEQIKKLTERKTELEGQLKMEYKHIDAINSLEKELTSYILGTVKG
jgi:hypothetical protein